MKERSASGWSADLPHLSKHRCPRKAARTRAYLLIHPGFQKAPQRHELFRQPPAGQRRGLI